MGSQVIDLQYLGPNRMVIMLLTSAGHIWRTQNGGATWSDDTIMLQGALSAGGVWRMIVRPSMPDRVRPRAVARRRPSRASHTLGGLEIATPAEPCPDSFAGCAIQVLFIGHKPFGNQTLYWSTKANLPLLPTHPPPSRPLPPRRRAPLTRRPRRTTARPTYSPARSRPAAATA